MYKILNQKINRPNPLSLKNIENLTEINIYPLKPGKLVFKDNFETTSYCLRCPNTPCHSFSQSELDSKSLPQFSYDRNTSVCPTNAIHIHKSEYYPVIDKDKCINCGICSHRCPIGAIYMSEVSACVNYDLNNSNIDSYYEVDNNTFYNNLNILKSINKNGILFIDNDSNLNKICDNILKEIKSNSNLPNLLTRNILLSLGTSFNLRRPGDVNLRMDAILGNDIKSLGTCEIEFGNDILNSPRNILDNIAIVCSRYSKNYDNIYPLIVSLELPNTRSEYWRVVQDIKNVFGIEINSISIGALLILLWNLEHFDITNYNLYADCDNLSIRNYIEDIINRPINISNGFRSILEINK